MSSFKGTYFKYDAAFVEPAIVSTKQALNFNLVLSEGINMIQFTLSQQSANAVITKIEDLSVSIHGVGRTNDGGLILRSADKAGGYVVSGDLYYKPTSDSNEVGPFSFSAEIPFDQTSSETMSFINVLGQLCTNSLPNATSVDLALDNYGIQCTLTVALTSDQPPHAGTNQYFIVDIDKIGDPDLTIRNATYSFASATNCVQLSTYVLPKLSSKVLFQYNDMTKLTVNSIKFNISTSKLPNPNLPVTSYITSIVLNAKIGNAEVANYTIAPSSAVEINAHYAHDGLVLKTSSSDPLVITDGTTSTTKITLAANSEFPIHYESTGEGVNTYLFAEGNIMPVIFESSTAVLFFGCVEYNEEIQFISDKDPEHGNTRPLISKISPGYTVYDTLKLPTSGNVVNFSTDAGFMIPVAGQDDHAVSTKYVRIADLYAALLKDETTIVPDLADRLHALEIACANVETNEINGDLTTTTEGYRLWKVKETYKNVTS